MEHLQLIESVRGVVSRAFHRHGITSSDITRETIMIRDGFYCGRNFVCKGFRAVWFLEENVIKFYAPSGEFLSAESIRDENRRVAA